MFFHYHMYTASRRIFHFILNVYIYLYLANMGRQENLVFYRWKMEWRSRHLVFWLLGTLNGLRDQVRGLVA
jgi:hypothetical protein